MLSEKQKEELIGKIREMDKDSVKGLIKNINPDKVDDPDLREFIKNCRNSL